MIHRVVEAITMEITMISVVVRRPLVFAAMQSRIDTSLRISWRMTALVQWSLNFNLPRGKTGIPLFGTNYGFDVKRWKCHVWIDLRWQVSVNKDEMRRSYRERESCKLACNLKGRAWSIAYPFEMIIISRATAIAVICVLPFPNANLRFDGRCNVLHDTILEMQLVLMNDVRIAFKGLMRSSYMLYGSIGESTFVVPKIT